MTPEIARLEAALDAFTMECGTMEVIAAAVAAVKAAKKTEPEIVALSAKLQEVQAERDAAVASALAKVHVVPSRGEVVKACPRCHGRRSQYPQQENAPSKWYCQLCDYLYDEPTLWQRIEKGV